MSQASDGVAVWRRVADQLRDLAATGVEKLPVESELAARFGVNRHTVRRAIAALAAEGLVRSERGRGTFVEPMPARLVYPVGARTRFTENISREHRQPSGRLIQSTRELADAARGAALGLRPGAPLQRLDVMGVADGVPLSLSSNWFSQERFPTIVAAYAETGSITKALRLCGVTDYRRHHTKLRADRVAPQDARHLACATDAIVMIAETVNYDLDERPIQASQTRFLAERVELSFEA
ncbi:phosphonate metabolism transcriptional regulator PhnF [Mangrovibrevibacter kandeliae]|uniref:phosphonate metabolism transcriptional regulator PhnF n=1 Tax=Mangrovibrevibacter kandeliae TaxID=2968473 RepID=UPI0021189921|nr:phosphonate metabolism transcriptional regulator PhnF [Aurantimonas sp. CSK15Z-1]MCQ8781248.1 phosphonate metabolism transcriptional regulator PhnF [Aurantimonas sp. CSK15Z-1]